jgi:polyisoprenoid-binding protein YceI
MNKRVAVALSTLTLAVLAGAPAQAAPVQYGLDASHSNVEFRVRHMMSRVSGSFQKFDANIVMDADAPAASKVTFTIDAASIDTANENRDKHLRSEDFFYVEKHPTISFESTAIRRLEGNEYEVKGNLTMRGVTREITLPVSFLGEIKDPWGNTKAGFSTRTTLNRKDYGVNWNKMLDNGGVLLADEVEIEIDLQVARK